jgi:hypothetical protein
MPTSAAAIAFLLISLFLGLIVAKFAVGTAAYFLHISDDGGFGEILLMIAIMVAFQAALIWRRAQPLSPLEKSRDDLYRLPRSRARRGGTTHRSSPRRDRYHRY